MRKDHPRIKQRIAFIILLFFCLSVGVTIISSFLFPPDYSVKPPVYSDNLMIASELGSALLICAVTMLGLKLADDREVIPAAGFTIFAIATGLIMVTSFELIGHQHELKSLETTYQMYVGSSFLFIPATILISFYSGFPKWLHYLTLASGIPYLVSNVFFLSGARNIAQLDALGMIGYFTQSVVQILWGVMVWKRRND
jgi:hypothetical protein